MSTIFIESVSDEYGYSRVQTNSKLILFKDIVKIRWKHMPSEAIYNEVLRGNLSVYTLQGHEYKNGEKIYLLTPYSGIKIGEWGIIDCENDAAVVILHEVEEIEGHGLSDPKQKKEPDLQPLPPSCRTEQANEARAEKKLAVWKELFPCMVRVYARMEPGRQYARKEVATLFEAEGVEVRVNKVGKPTGAMFGYFWQVFTNSGLPIADLSKCGSPDVSAATTTDPLPDDN